MQWIGAALGAVMRLCYQWVQNYGLAVILFTILSKIILFPVSLWVHQNGIKMVRMQARINRIKIRHFGDGDAIAEEQGKLYKQERYNPFLGVVPIFVQLFLLIGLIQVIYHPLSYILQLPQDLCQAVIGAAHQLGGIDAASGSAELLATADMASVRSAMSALQSELDALDEEISQAEGDTVSSYISAGVAGRVKAIYASEGSGVAEVMVDKGALALISLDGSGRVLCVPVAALDKEGSQGVVYTGCDEDGGRLTDPVAVTTGVSDGEYVQLLSGLEKGQTVYYAWYEAGRETGLPELSPPFGA